MPSQGGGLFGSNLSFGKARVDAFELVSEGRVDLLLAGSAHIHPCGGLHPSLFRSREDGQRIAPPCDHEMTVRHGTQLAAHHMSRVIRHGEQGEMHAQTYGEDRLDRALPELRQLTPHHSRPFIPP